MEHKAESTSGARIIQGLTEAVKAEQPGNIGAAGDQESRDSPKPTFPARSRQRARALRIEGDVAFVPLTKGYEAIIDAADAEAVAGRNWHAMPCPSTVYAARTDTVLGCQMLHRVLISPPDHLVVDHINGDGLDNRRANLRICTRQENVRSARRGRGNSTGLKGVSLLKGRHRACIHLGGRSVHLGMFDTAAEAKAAYDRAAAEHFGEFAHVG